MSREGRYYRERREVQEPRNYRDENRRDRNSSSNREEEDERDHKYGGKGYKPWEGKKWIPWTEYDELMELKKEFKRAKEEAKEKEAQAKREEERKRIVDEITNSINKSLQVTTPMKAPRQTDEMPEDQKPSNIQRLDETLAEVQRSIKLLASQTNKRSSSTRRNTILKKAMKRAKATPRKLDLESTDEEQTCFPSDDEAINTDTATKSSGREESEEELAKTVAKPKPTPKKNDPKAKTPNKRKHDETALEAKIEELEELIGYDLKKWRKKMIDVMKKYDVDHDPFESRGSNIERLAQKLLSLA